MAATAESLQHEALTAQPAELAAWLQLHLGQRLTAFAVGLGDAKLIGRYAKGRNPGGATLFKLQAAYQAARLLVDAYGDTTARSWFFGTNSRLDDEAPAVVLRDAQGPQEVGRILVAARAFANAEFAS